MYAETTKHSEGRKVRANGSIQGDINFIAEKVLAMIIKSGATWGKPRRENLMFHSSSV